MSLTLPQGKITFSMEPLSGGDLVLRFPSSEPDKMVELRTPPWEQLAVQMTEGERNFTAATFEKEVADQTVLALRDRNCFTEPWRKVFVVHNAVGMCVHVFDEHGTKIDEPADGVADGVQLLHGAEGTFLDDLQHGFYEQPCALDADSVHDDDGGEELDEESVELYVADKRCKKGARMAISFESCWEGCVVDEVITDPLSVVLAFDDGDLKVRTAEQLEQDLTEDCLKFIGPEVGGIVNSTEGLPAAVRVARQKDGQASQARAVGVLVGSTKYCLAGDTIFESFFVDPDAFSGGRETASKRRTAATTAQDRLGLHTLRRGDVVEYIHVQDGEECRAAVFGITWPEANAGRKYVVLHDAAAQVFSVGGYTDWRRVHTKDCSDVDDNNTALTLSLEELEKMMAAWAASNVLAHLDTAKKVANQTRNLPPNLKQIRAEATRIAKEEEAARMAERKRARREEVLAKGKEKGGKGKGKGGGAKGRKGGRGNGKGGKAADQPDDDDDDERPLSDRMRPQADVTALVAAAKETASRKHAAEVHALQQQLAAAKAAAAASDKPEPPPQPLPSPTLPHGLPPGLPPGWRMAKDMRGRKYYFNKSLNLSQYELPELESPPLPPPKQTPESALPDCSRPSQTSRGSTSSAVASQPWEVDERRNRITRIRGILEYCDNRQDKAELNGELAVLLRQESVYMQSQ